MTEKPTAADSAPVPLVPRRRRWWWTLLLSLVIFGAGLTIGASGTVIFIRHELLQAIHKPEQMPERIAQRLRSRLGLSYKQTAQVLAILQTRQRALQKIRGRVQPEVEAQLALVERDVSAVLDPRQREKWEQDFRRMRLLWVPPVPAATDPDAARRSGSDG